MKKTRITVEKKENGLLDKKVIECSEFFLATLEGSEEDEDVSVCKMGEHSPLLFMIILDHLLEIVE